METPEAGAGGALGRREPATVRIAMWSARHRWLAPRTGKVAKAEQYEIHGPRQG